MITRLLPWITLLVIPLAAAGPDAAEIARLIEQLGSDEYARREEASKKLEAIGEPARAAVKAAVTSADAEIRRRARRLLWTFDAKLLVLRHTFHSAEIHGVALSPDGGRVISSSQDGTVRVIDVSTGKQIHRLEHPSAYCVAISRDGKKVLSTAAGDMQPLRLWDLDTGKELSRFTEYRGTAYRAVLSPDQKLALLAAFPDNTVRLVDLRSGKEVKRFEGHTHRVHAVAMSADGRRSLSGGLDATVRLWDNATGKELKRFDGHREFVWAVAFSPDGKRAVSGGEERLILVWDLETGKMVRRIEPHAAGVHALVFSRDGRLASASYGSAVSLWDIETGKECHRFEGHTDKVYDVAFSADGRFLVSAGHDRTVRVWRVPR